MAVGILYAMKKEAAGLLTNLDSPSVISGIPCWPLPGGHVLCAGGVGKVNAAMAAQLLIDRFSVTEILNPGCAGALTDLPFGTIVVGSDCVQHDVDTTLAGDPPGFVSTVEVVRFPCARSGQTTEALKRKGLRAVTGTIATGDWFGRDYPRAESIRDRWGALVCDMEAAAAAQVCLRNGIPFLALKSVSDHLFSPCQEREYTEHFGGAMASLDAAVTACLMEESIWNASPAFPSITTN